MPRPKQFLMLVFMAVIVVASAMFGLPYLWAKGVPGYLNKQVSPLIEIETASFSHSPPELVLSGVHLRNPAEYGSGDAIRIDRINVVFTGYSRNPMHIRSVLIDGIKSRYVVRGQSDNFTTLRQEMLVRKNQVARGQLAKPVLVDRIFMGPSSMQNEDGSVIRALPAMELQITDNPAAPANGLQVVTGVFTFLIQQEQTGVIGVKVENFKEKAEETIRSIGQSIKDYITQPGHSAGRGTQGRNSR